MSRLGDWSIRERALANPAFIFPVSHVEGPVQCVFDRPMIPYGVGELLAVTTQAAEEVTGSGSARSHQAGFDAEKKVKARPRQAESGDDQKPRSRKRLADLPLSAEDLEVLQRQGFISEESRGRGRSYFKLRFRRRDGRQVVHGLGTDRGAVEQIRHELAALQSTCQIDRRLSRLARDARETLRRSKRELEARLAEIGYHFWGSDIRKRRSARLANQAYKLANLEGTGAGRGTAS